MKKLLLKWLMYGVLFYTFLGFFLLPYFIQFSVSPLLKKHYGIEVYINSVHFNPFRFSCKLTNFILKDEKKENLVYFEELYLNLDPSSFLNNTLYIKELKLDNARVNIDLDKNKKANFQFLLDKFTSSDTSSKDRVEEQSSMRLYIEQFDLSFFTFLFEDASKAQLFDIETKPINFVLKDISLDKDHTNKIDLELHTKKSGEIHLISDVVFEPLSAKGSVELKNILLDKFYYYAKPIDLELDIDSKVLNSSLSYQFKAFDGKNSIVLSDLHTALPQTILQMEDFGVLLKEYHLGVDSVELLQEKENIQYTVQGITSKLAKLEVEDKKLDNTLEFINLNTKVPTVTSDKTKEIELIHSLETKTNGKVSLASSLVQEPLSAKGTLKLSKIDLVAYKRYIEEFVNIDLRSALLDIDSRFDYQQDKQKNIIELSSDILLKDINIENSMMKQPLLKIEMIDIASLKYKNDQLNIDKVKITKPDFEFYMNKDKTTNFTKLVKHKEQSQENKDEKEDQSKEKSSLEYTVKEVVLQNGEAKFFDNTLKIPFSSHETQVNVYAKNITSKKGEYTQIDHDSIVDQYGILKAKGSLIVSEPLKDLDVNIDIRNIDLPSLSSYSGKFIGNKIDNGKLSVKFDHKIENKKLLLANNLRIKDIKLGEEVKSEDAIDAPIGLAIALLEDSEGYIDLDVPIDGDLENPNFHISDVIFDVIRNTIVGIVSAPFKFLGAIIGLDSAEDISRSYFDYGDAKIEAQTKEKLDKLVEALGKRPGIELKIKPSYLVDEDREALIQKGFEIKYPSLLDVTKELSIRVDEVSSVFIELYSQDEFDAIELEEEQKLEFMLDKIKQTIKVSKSDLELLAQQRVENIKNYLITQKIEAKRIEILKEFDTTNKEKRLEQVIVSFELGINK